MKRYHGKEKVDPGIYFNLRQLSFKSMDEEGRLPGTEQDVFHRVPTVALLVVGPVLGLTYVIFLPLIGFAMLGWVAGGKVLEGMAHAGAASVRVLTPAWQPLRAFLSRGKRVGRPARRADRWAAEAKKELEKETDDRS